MTLDAMEFLRRFLHKVRHYGFLSANGTTSIEACVAWRLIS
jgi:hypothetical protein